MPFFLAVVRDGPGTRKRVHDAIRAEPGASKNRLKMRVGVAWHTVEHHIKTLVKEGVVTLIKDQWRHEVYPTEVPPEERFWLRHMYDENAVEVIAVMVDQPPMSTLDICASLDRSKKSVLTDLNRLVHDGVVIKLGVNRPRYRLAAPPLGIQPYLAHLGTPAKEAEESAQMPTPRPEIAGLEPPKRRPGQ